MTGFAVILHETMGCLESISVLDLHHYHYLVTGVKDGNPFEEGQGGRVPRGNSSEMKGYLSKGHCSMEVVGLTLCPLSKSLPHMKASFHIPG